MSSQEVAEQLDYYGAWLQPSATFHNSYVSLYSLNKHIRHTVPLLEKIVKKPLFPEHEFEVARDRRLQNFLVEEERVQVIAFNQYIDKLFGNKYPYGQHASAADFQNITTDHLKAYHQKYYNSANCRVILTGKVTEDILSQLFESFGNEKWGENILHTSPQKTADPSQPGRYLYVKSDAFQSAVRIGMPIISREHPDYPKLRILNTLLGGYFGSRLMANIREDKGYTYGIGSVITTFKNASYLSISSQVATQFTEDLIHEVFVEIRRLKDELVGPEELQMLKGYLMGEMARLFDGPFSIADAHQSLLANNMTVDYYNTMIEAIQNVTSEELRDLANKYLIEDRFYTIISGQKQ